MHYKPFIQQYVIHNHGGEYEDDDKLIDVAVRVADKLVKRGLLTKNSREDGED